MSAFLKALRRASKSHAQTPRRWAFVPYDQLSSSIGPLTKLAPHRAGVVLVETTWKSGRRPYHKQKLALVLANQRFFAIEQARRGVAVRYVFSDRCYREALAPLIDELGPLVMMEPAERELRIDLAPLVALGDLQQIPHTGFLTTPEQFTRSQKPGAPFRMSAFYQTVRADTGYLMQADGRPEGGRWSFDTANRKPWPGKPAAPEALRFPVDVLKAEVCDLIEQQFAHHPGTLERDRIPATRADIECAWSHARTECLPQFGPYEDAMSERSRTLFHTQIGGLLNLHRLLPRRVCEDALREADVPLQSREGFLRQVLGWREFVRHVHRETDGFRVGADRVAKTPGDAGFARWKKAAFPSSHGPASIDGGAAPAGLGAGRPVPEAYWGVPSGLRCLDTVVSEVWEHAYSHHIARLMVLANLGTLLGIEPRDLADWFWVAYQDAYDWVVEPNVLAMGTFAVGPVMTTKPYVSGAAYINRMSDYCGSCAFDPKRNCPITRLYWNFLNEQRETLRGSPRLSLVLSQVDRRSEDDRSLDQATAQVVWERLAAGRAVTPDDLPVDMKSGKS